MRTIISVILALGVATPTQFVSQPEVVIQATGMGRAPAHVSGGQARLMAQRAAEVDALRRLAESMEGTSVRSTAGPDRWAHTTQEAWLSGYRFLTPRGLSDGSIEVTVELPIRAIHSQEAAHFERIRSLECELQQTRQNLAQAHARIAELEQWIQHHR